MEITIAFKILLLFLKQCFLNISVHADNGGSFHLNEDPGSEGLCLRFCNFKQAPRDAAGPHRPHFA